MNRLRRGLWSVAVVGALSGMLLTASGSGAAEAAPPAFVNGAGQASASVVSTRLFYAGYSLSVSTGLSATSYENVQSRALGAAYDLSSVFNLVKQHVAALSPVSIDSNSGDAAKTTDLGAGPIVGNIALTAKHVPASTSDVRLAGLDLPGLLHVDGGHASSSSAIVHGTERRAQSSVTVASVSLLGGVVTLDGLRWDASHRTGSADEQTARFTLADLKVGGVAIAHDLHDLDPVLDAINAALRPVGFELTAPKVQHPDNGSVAVTPLQVGLLNSPLGAKALSPAIAGIRPLLQPVYDALAGVNEELGLTSLVADLGLGVLDGSGGIEVSIGGATAITDDTVYADPFANPPSAAPTAPTSTVGGSLPSLGGGFAAPATPGTAATGPQVVRTSVDGPMRCVLAASPRRHGSCRGTNVPGAIAVVAIVAAGVATWDVRLRRRLGAADLTGAPPA